MKLADKLFGTHSERELKRIYPLVDKVESLRDTMMALSDDELKGKTKEFKERLNQWLNNSFIEHTAVYYLHSLCFFAIFTYYIMNNKFEKQYF